MKIYMGGGGGGGKKRRGKLLNECSDSNPLIPPLLPVRFVICKIKKEKEKFHDSVVAFLQK